MAESTQNGAVTVVEPRELELPAAVLLLIGDVITASPQFTTLAQRLIGLVEGRGLPSETPIRLVVTAAKVVLGAPDG
jgi:hypothetical protein